MKRSPKKTGIRGHVKEISLDSVKIKEKANDIKDQARNKYGEVSEKVKDQYGSISSTFKETASNVAHTVKDGYDKYKDQIVSKTADVVKNVESELNDLK